MAPCQRITDILKVINSLNQLLKVIVLSLKSHGPIPHKWSSSAENIKTFTFSVFMVAVDHTIMKVISYLVSKKCI